MPSKSNVCLRKLEEEIFFVKQIHRSTKPAENLSHRMSRLSSGSPVFGLGARCTDEGFREFPNSLRANVAATNSLTHYMEQNPF
jgi:hypothetical protein